MKRALIFANGDLNPGPRVAAALAFASEALLVAADGGARHMQALGLMPNRVIGDLDSLTAGDLAHYESLGVELSRHPAAKDETDLELALRYAVEQDATWIRVLGGVGGRLDQLLGNVLLLTLPQLAGRDVRLVDGRLESWVLAAGEHPMRGEVGDTVSLIPLGGNALGVSTRGLVYPLHDDTLRFGPARGISNVLAAPQASVRLREGLLLVVHTLGRA